MSPYDDRDHQVSILAKRLKGLVRTDLEAIAEASVDFGRVIFSKPHVVVWPASVSEVAAVVRYAREMRWTVTVRGAGHSQGGQSLNRGGIVIDTRHLSGVEVLNKEEGWVIVGAGTLWSALVRTVAGQGLLPPVLTDNLAVTIGGTLSVGGVGPASFRHGLQVGHCLGVEVVLGTGEVVWLTPESEPELFYHILCGLGQFGIITRAKLRLRPFRRYTQSIYLTYRNLDSFLNDALILMKRDCVHLLEGAARPAIDPTAQASGLQHLYLLEVSTEVDELADVAGQQLIQGLSGEARWTMANRQTQQHVFRLEKTFEGYKRPAEQDQAHPWVEHYLPFSVVKEYVSAVTPCFPSTSLLLWPMQTENLRLPLFAMPETAEVVLVGIMASIPHPRMAEVLPLLQHANELGITLGGKRYLSGWIDFDQEDWRQHYGSTTWACMAKLKQQYDPDQILQALPFWG